MEKRKTKYKILSTSIANARALPLPKNTNIMFLNKAGKQRKGNKSHKKLSVKSDECYSQQGCYTECNA
jgi:hypothetical protein